MIDKVRELFAKYEVELSVEEPKAEQEATPAATEVTQLAAAMLDSGQEIQTSAEAFAEGVDVFVVNEDGEQIPLPDGSYKLEDGTAFEVAEGVISSMAEAAPEETPVEASAEDAKEETALSRAEVMDLIKEAVTELSAHVDKMIQARDEEITNLSKQAAGKVARLDAPQKKAYTQAELASMPIEARIRAIQSQFN